jgi:Sulfatase-modifying factor enzyme 1
MHGLIANGRRVGHGHFAHRRSVRKRRERLRREPASEVRCWRMAGQWRSVLRHHACLPRRSVRDVRAKDDAVRRFRRPDLQLQRRMGSAGCVHGGDAALSGRKVHGVAAELRRDRRGTDELRREPRELLHEPRGDGRDLLSHLYELGRGGERRGRSRDWTTNLDCYTATPTWTESPGVNENLPLNCENWYEAYAFCIWDGGFLPSEAEWEYAAAGGDEQLEYPWGSTDPGSANEYAIYDCFFPTGTVDCTNTNANIAPVGTPTMGAGRWGQLDIVGDLWKWNLDWYQTWFQRSLGQRRQPDPRNGPGHAWRQLHVRCGESSAHRP